MKAEYVYACFYQNGKQYFYSDAIEGDHGWVTDINHAKIFNTMELKQIPRIFRGVVVHAVKGWMKP